MSSDGAEFGVTAERALGTILGGEPTPTDDECMDPIAFEEYIRSAPDTPDYGTDAA